MIRKIASLLDYYGIYKCVLKNDNKALIFLNFSNSQITKDIVIKTIKILMIKGGEIMLIAKIDGQNYLYYLYFKENCLKPELPKNAVRYEDIYNAIMLDTIKILFL